MWSLLVIMGVVSCYLMSTLLLVREVRCWYKILATDLWGASLGKLLEGIDPTGMRREHQCVISLIRCQGYKLMVMISWPLVRLGRCVCVAHVDELHLFMLTFTFVSFFVLSFAVVVVTKWLVVG
jgi:hypothetical protein